MHRYGTLAVDGWLASAPTIDGLNPEPWTLKGLKILECRTEIDDEPADNLVPPSLRPAIPAYAAITVSRVPDSPVGAFTLAELRVAARVGGRPVCFLLNSYCDSAAARQALAARWGYRVAAGEVALSERHFRAVGTVAVGGRTILEVRLTHREALPGTRLNVLPTVGLARNRADGRTLLTGLAIEASYGACDGGRQDIATLDPEAFNCGRWLKPLSPMSITIGTADLTLRGFEFTVDPVQPAEESTTFLA